MRRSASSRAVVLLVPAAAALELAVDGQRLGVAAEVLEGVAAEVVEPAGELVQQEVAERRALLDGDLRRQRARLGRPGRMGFADPQVHQPAAEVVGIHPAAHRRVMLRGHQQGEREAVQGAFRGALPRGLAVADPQQFAGVRQRVLRIPVPSHSRRRSSSWGSGSRLGRDCRLRQFGADLGQPRVELGAGDGQRRSGFPAARRTARRAPLPPRRAWPGWRRRAPCPRGPAVPGPSRPPHRCRSAAAGSAIPRPAGRFGVDGGQPAAAVAADVLLDGRQLVPQPVISVGSLLLSSCSRSPVRSSSAWCSRLSCSFRSVNQGCSWSRCCRASSSSRVSRACWARPP